MLFDFRWLSAKLVAAGPNALVTDYELLPGDALAAKLWDLESGAELRRFEGHEGFVTSVAVLPDGRRTLSGSGDFIIAGDTIGRIHVFRLLLS